MLTVAAWILLAAILLLALNHLAPQVYRYFQYRRWLQSSGVLALTYDDGPDSETSTQLLQLLHKHQVRATFYLVGFRAKQVPGLVNQTRRAGHEVGTHSHSHLHAWKVMPWRDLRDAEAGYRSLAPEVPANAPYRPPFGKISLPTFIWMLAKGRRIDWWTSPTNDTDDEFTDPAQLADRLVAPGHPVVLMHSHHAEPHRREYMLTLTEAIILRAKAKGLRIVTMSELEALHN